jgi:hypothetical protein
MRGVGLAGWMLPSGVLVGCVVLRLLRNVDLMLSLLSGLQSRLGLGLEAVYTQYVITL